MAPGDMLNGTATSVMHRYWDDNPTQSPEDWHEITVVANRNGHQVTRTLPVLVKNIAPTVAASLDASQNMVGDPIRLSGTFADPGMWDSQNLVVNWGDGSGNQAVTVSGGYGVWSFDVTHQYSAADSFQIELFAWDDDGEQPTTPTWSALVAIAAVAPTILAPPAVNEGDPLSVTLAADASIDYWTIQWGDGAMDTIYAYSATTTATHTYADDNPIEQSDAYQITATAHRNGQAYAAEAKTVVVNNVPAVFTQLPSLSNPSPYVNESVTLTFGLADGALTSNDTLHYKIQWGDGAEIQGSHTYAASVSETHAYATPGNHTVTVTIWDDDMTQATGLAYDLDVVASFATIQFDDPSYVIELDSIPYHPTPVIAFFSIVVQENAALGHVAAAIAAHSDRGLPLTYTMEPLDPGSSVPFMVDGTTGALIVSGEID